MKSANAKAEHYGNALLSIGLANGCTEALKADLEHLVTFLQATPALLDFLRSPAITIPGKQQALAELIGSQIHVLLFPFVLLLTAAGDIAQLAAIRDAVNTLENEESQALAGEIQCAVPLSEAQVAAIETEVGRLLNGTVHLTPRITDSILGGMRVCVGDVVIDDTIDTQLENAQHQLLQ